MTTMTKITSFCTTSLTLILFECGSVHTKLASIRWICSKHATEFTMFYSLLSTLYNRLTNVSCTITFTQQRMNTNELLLIASKLRHTTILFTEYSLNKPEPDQMNKHKTRSSATA